MERAADQKVQHYVPKLLLRQFRAKTGRRPMIHVFDKSTQRSYPTNIKNVASESRFYDFEQDGQTYSAEPTFGKVETDCEPALTRMINTRVVPRDVECAEDIAAIAFFISMQFFRTRWMKNMWEGLPDLFAAALSASHEKFSEEILEQFGAERDSLGSAIPFMVKSACEAVGIFVAKTWVLLRTDSARPFLIGDNPVAMQNSVPANVMQGNIGLAVPGIEIYLPLTPTLTLGLWDDSSINEMRAAHRTAKLLHSQGRIDRATLEMFEQLGSGLDQALRTGDAVDLRPENVLNLNSLQIKFSERFVMSSTSDFRLVNDMIEIKSTYKHGPRSTIT